MAAPKLRNDLRAETTAARLAAAPAPASGGAFAAARADARARLESMGLPVRRDEYWRWTDPAALNAPEAAVASVFDDDDDLVFDSIDRLKLVFVDGVFDAGASDAPEMAGLEIQRLAGADSSDIHWAASLYGQLETAGQSPVARPFAALNTATATDGVLIRATGKAERPVALIYRRSSDAADVSLHHVVKVEAGAEITLLETGPAAARFSTVLEVDVAEGGTFHHVRSQGRDHDRRAVTHLFARVAGESLFKSFTLTLNGALTRNEAWIDIAGDDASAHIAGAVVGDGKDDRFHHDDTVFVTHGALRGESRQVFKKVLKNGAQGVFQGKILVKPGAQKTDGYQISQSLLLDGDSQFLAKPELEIYADDVQCSHGSTTGAIDETALFYLRSRGVPLDQAQALLVLSFLGDAIEEIACEDLKGEIVKRLEGWLQRRL